MRDVLDRLRSVTEPPVLDTEEKTRQAQLAYRIAWTIVIVPLLYGAYSLFTSEASVPLIQLLPALIPSAVSLLLTFLIRRGSVRLSSVILVLIVWLGFASLSYNLGGIADAGYAGFIVVITMAGLLLGGPAAMVTMVVSLLLGWALADAEIQGKLPIDFDTPMDRVLNYLVLFLLSTGLVSAANRGLKTLLRRVLDNERDLRARNWELQNMRDSLEVRVAERTEDLDRRSRYLEAAAQVAYRSGEILDIDQLMRESLDLIREAFGLYYVGFFTIDGAREWAELRAGTGEAGVRMLARGHRIRVGSGMIGWCIAHGEGRIAQHAENDHVRVVAPELPATRAEAALPLRARGQVLGALTVQSLEPDFFDDATATVLQTMADLLAVALSNAALVEESKQSMLAVRRAYGEIASEAWDELLQSRGNWGYRYADGIVSPVTGELDQAIRAAIENESMVQQPKDVPTSVALPLRVGGHVVGAINYRRSQDEGIWGAADMALLQTVTDQLAQAMDSARLLQETRSWAAREQRVNNIASQLSNAVDVDMLLRAAVDELGRLPGVLQASVHIALPEDSASDPSVPKSSDESLLQGHSEN